ncbi:dihydropteroate synthase [Mergibacter septicus]|uniref:dihydropteroate synthase n=1 Tax=Mergibacter septicus TaxID=221402 RepID=UPI0028115C49|nr:dihydropteroate synthase [Mergibacter septicus]WMR95421.1 dihydropteroate synthase [Mergibacter septicus]
MHNTQPIQSEISLPQIMGILNVTPDSFSDNGKFFNLDSALFHVEEMLNAGADIIDVGGESTRPQASVISLQQELDRVLPIIEAITQRFDCLISIDTSKAEVMQQAIALGADMINDIRALQQPNALETAARLNVPVCLMHMQGTPQTMQHNPQYQDVVTEVETWLITRATQCIAAGIKPDNIILDPGLGFGKTVQHNYQLLKHCQRFSALGFPVLIGLSRKSMLGAVLNKTVEQRLIGSVSGALLAAVNGAKILRVHDVAETVEAIKIFEAMTLADQSNFPY